MEQTVTNSPPPRFCHYVTIVHKNSPPPPPPPPSKKINLKLKELAHLQDRIALPSDPVVV
ncbi:unnamed protein product, partial [Candidula unifasciata]